MLTLSKLAFPTNSVQSLAIGSISAIATSIICIGTATESVSAISLIGNNTGSNTTINSNLIDTDKYLGVQFTTPSSPVLGYKLDSVVLRLSNFRTNGVVGSANSDKLLVSITGNDGIPTTTPGSDLFADFSTPTSPNNTLRLVTLNANSNFIFTPSTTYWLLVAAADATTTFNWASNDDSGTVGTNESITPTGVATLGASGYQYTTDAGVTFTSPTAFSSFNINATAVPFEFEPIAGVLVLGGLWGVNKLRKRKKHTGE